MFIPKMVLMVHGYPIKLFLLVFLSGPLPGPF